MDSWTVRLVDPTCGPDLWTRLMDPTRGPLKIRFFLRIGLVERPTCGPKLWTRIMDPTRSPDLFTPLVDPTRGALKTMSCSGLDSWIVRLVDPNRGPDSFTRLIHLTLGPDSWSLKNKQLFRIGLVDQRREGGVQLVEP